MLTSAGGAFVVFLLSVGIVSWVNSFDYKELRDSGVSCYPRDSCQCCQHQINPAEGKTCECDPTCYRRGTCCIDSPYVDSRQSTRKEVCSSKRRIGISSHYYFSDPHALGYNVFQVERCDTRWSGPLQLRQLCEIEEPVDGIDPMIAIPVTNIYSGVTYKNYYCALCNNDIEGCVLWDFTITEDYSSDLSDRFTIQASDKVTDGSNSNAEGSSSCDDNSTVSLVFNTARASYGYWDYCSNISNFISVSILLSIPDQIQHLVKGCLNVISSCSPDWTDVRVKVLCESYLGIIKGPSQSTESGFQPYGETYFRNVHCALCNNVTDFEGYSCHPFSTTPILTPSYPVSLTMLLAQHLADEKCSEDQKFVKSLGGCRAVICANRQYKVKNGKCSPQ